MSECLGQSRSEWVAALGESLERVRSLTGELSHRQLNRRPGPRRWSVAQCLDHIGVSTRRYLELMEPVLARAKRERAGEREHGDPYGGGTWVGRVLLRALRKPGARYPAPPSFRPARGELDPHRVRAELASTIGRLREAIETSRGLPLGLITMPWPVFRPLRVSLAQAFELLVLHTDRHLVQAERAAGEAGSTGRSEATHRPGE